MTRRWSWFVEGYYTQDVKPPKEPGGLSIRVGGISREALELDRQILEEDPEIGEIIGPFEIPR